MKMRWVAVGLVWVGVWAGLAVGQSGAKADSSAALRNDKQKRAMTFADLMAMKRVSDPQISASGEWVMFSVTDVSLEKNTKVNHLWVVGLGGGGEAEGKKQIPSGNDKQKDSGAEGEQQVTFGEGESNGRFSPDGKWVSISMKDQIYLAPWDEAAGKVGAAVQLTHVSGGADGAIWSPDSKRLMFVADVYPECSVKGGRATTEILTGGQNDEQRRNTGVLHSVQDDVFKTMEAATWAAEDACDKAKDDAAAASPVKGQVWDALLYRHWDHYTGLKRSHVLIVSATDGNTVRDLTPASVVGNVEVPTYFVGGVQNYAWAPDSKEIAYVAKLDKVPAASTNNDVFTLRLDEAGAKAVKVSTSPGSDDGPAYSPDGKYLAFRSQARGGFEADRFRLMLFDREKRAVGEFIPYDDDWIDEFAWSPDSHFIYEVTGYHGAEVIGRLAMPEVRKTPTRAGVSSAIRISGQGEFSSLVVSPDGQSVVALGMRVNSPAALFTFASSSSCDSLFGDVGPSLEELSKYDNRCSDADAKGGAGQREPSHLLTHLNDETVGKLSMSPLELFWFHGAEGTPVEGFLIKPPNFDPKKKYPVKFLMHGGPQTAWGDAWSFRWNWELMAANGYVVVGINRRGSTGYGQKFVDEVSGDWGGRAYVDLMKGLDYAETKFPFMDKTRECALGASYGGYMADWVLTHTNRFKCIVTHDGLYDPASAWGDTEEMWFNEWEFRRAEDFPKGWDGIVGGGVTKANTGVLHSVQDDGRRGQNDGQKRNTGVLPAPASKLAGDPVRSAQNDKQERSDLGHAAEPWRYQALPADQDPFRKWSPMRFIENAKTPTLVIHSQKDMRLDVSQGIAMFTALQRLGVPSKMLYFPDEGHWVLKPQNSQMWNEVVGDWCDRWTKTGKYAE